MPWNKAQKQFFLVSGLSGSGKTTALKALEDLGFFCTDNLPIHLLKNDHPFEQWLSSSLRTALGMDIRDPRFIKEYPELIAELQQKIPQLKILFLDCAEASLLRRFSESRRPHPLGRNIPLIQAIKQERKKLNLLKLKADYVLDTSQLNVHQLKNEIHKLLGRFLPMPACTLTLTSFAYKKGIPLQSDWVVDVRFLKNPFFHPKLSKLTGKDKRVQNFIFRQKETKIFMKNLAHFLNYILIQNKKEGKAYVNIAMGCTGGQHRSVAMVERLPQLLKIKDFSVFTFHRDLIE